MDGSKKGPSNRVQVPQVQARRKKQEGQRQHRSDTIRKGHFGVEDAALSMGQAEEELACPDCHLRFDYGMRCLDCDAWLVGVSFLTRSPPPVVTVTSIGPRYCCEKCGTRGDCSDRCARCDHWEMFDLHRAADRRYAKILAEQRQRKLRHLFSAAGLLCALLGLVVLLLGTVYVALPALLIGLFLILGGGAMAAGGPISR